MEIIIDSIEQLTQVAHQIIPLLNTQKVLLVNGEMGAGKTTFISSLVKAMGSTDEISSPTFSIVNEYQSQMGIIYHFDFYRIKSIDEALDFGVEEYFYSNNYCLIEWSALIKSIIPDNALEINIIVKENNVRHFFINH